MELSREIKSFVEDYVKNLREDSAAIFAGAGLSVSVGYVNWKDLLRRPAKRIGLDVDKETDLVAVAQYLYNINNNSKQPIAQLVRNKFSSGKININHKILATLPIKTYWTTNYDSLIEDGLKAHGKNTDVKKCVKDLSTIVSKRDAIIYKMHGDIDNVSDIVLIKDDYELYDYKYQLFSLSLKADLISKTFLFIGFSFDDPNLEYILSKVRILTDGYSRPHYCFFRRVTRSDYPDDEQGEKDFKYSEIKQELKCADLKRYQIHALLIDDYEDITKILKIIESEYKKDHILISGSADEYNDFKIKDIKPLEFIHNLSNEISKLGCKIVSGIGKNIGSAVLNGVLNHMYSTNKRNMDDYIIMRPFPLYSINDINYEEIKIDYRKNMIELAGISIFILGNKMVEGNLQIADGVIQEFEMAHSSGVYVIPIGVTGYASKELWNRVISNFNDFYPDNTDLLECFQLLGDGELTSDKIIEAVCKIICELNGFDYHR